VKLIIVLLFSAINLFPQVDNVKPIGSFRNAGSFFINPAGFIYVTDLNENKVYKIDTLGNVLKEIGGYGWESSAFDDPIDIFATPLNVYIADKNNHRIQWFDKDLNFISLLQTKNNRALPNGNNRDNVIQFGYPLGTAITAQGDLLILDSENNRLLKLDMFGNLLLEFGGLDAGKFRINRPISMAVLDNQTFVLDKRGKRVVVFDLFGTGLSIINLEDKMVNIAVSDGRVLLNNSDSVYQLSLSSGGVYPLTLPDGINDIKDVFIFNNQIFLLTSGKIIVSPVL
jgi:DNA-binding beta-propeller fold protein YncE